MKFEVASTRRSTSKNGEGGGTEERRLNLTYSSGWKKGKSTLGKGGGG